MLLRGQGESALTVMLFGVGLIGGELSRCLRELGFVATPRNWNWFDSRAQQRSGDGLLEEVSADPRRSVAVLWAAGRAGPSANEAEAAAELENFGRVVDLVRTLYERDPGRPLSVHLLSSAGGLFEGRVLVSPSDVPAPTSPYGRLKLAQEQRLRGLPSAIGRQVYRPTSVYGIPAGVARMGLIPTLLLRGMRGRGVRVTGRPDTLRDYVSAWDVARFVVYRLLHGCSSERAPWLLASGQPTSLFQLKSLVERVLGRPVYCQFDATLPNAANTTFAQNRAPRGWRTVELPTGVRLVHQALLEDPSVPVR